MRSGGDPYTFSAKLIYNPAYVSTYNSYIGVCNIKISTFLAEHRKTEENRFWGLTVIRNSSSRS